MFRRGINFIFRSLKYTVSNLHIILSLIMAYLCIYVIGHFVGWYSSFIDFINQTKHMVISILLTVLIVDFLKSERERRRQLRSQFSLYYLMLRDFQFFIYGMWLVFGEHDVFLEGYYKSLKNPPIYTSSHDKKISVIKKGSTRKNFWTEKVEIVDTRYKRLSAFSSRKDLVIYLCNNYKTNLKDDILFHSGILDGKIYRPVFQLARHIQFSNNIENACDEMFYAIYLSIQILAELGAPWVQKNGSFYGVR